jgi:hypothetical protein
MSGGGVCHALVCRQSRDVLWPEADSMSQLGVSQPASILPVSRHGGSVSSVRCTCATLLPASSRSRRVSLCVAVASQVLLSTAMEHWTRVRHLQQQRQEVRQAIEAAKDAVSRSFVGIASQQAASKVRCGPLSRPPHPHTRMRCSSGGTVASAVDATVPMVYVLPLRRCTCLDGDGVVVVGRSGSGSCRGAAASGGAAPPCSGAAC